MHWSFGKYWFNELCRSSKCWHIPLYNIKKITFVFNVILEKVLKVLTCYQAHSCGHKFSQILILLESSNFTTDNKFWRPFSLKWQANFIHFWMNARCPTLNNNSLKNGVPWKKKVASSACNSSNCISETATILHCAEILYVHFQYCHIIWKKMCTQQGLRCNKN